MEGVDAPEGTVEEGSVQEGTVELCCQSTKRDCPDDNAEADSANKRLRGLSTPSETSIVAEAPILTETPEVAEALILAETPEVAEAPILVETPKVAEAPILVETPKVAEVSISSVAPKFEDEIILIKRPDKGGTEGRKVDLHANHFRISLSKDLVVNQYDISVGRSGDRRPQKDRDAHTIFWAFVSKYPEIFGKGRHTVYDRRKIAYSTKVFVGTTKETVSLQMQSMLPQDKYDRERKVTLSVKHVGELTISGDKNRHLSDPQQQRQESQFLELLFRQGRHFNHMLVPIGKSFYFQLENSRRDDPQTDRSLLQTHARRIDLGCGRELLRGFYMSTRIIDNWRLSLNVNWSSIPCFQEIRLVDFIEAVFSKKLNRRGHSSSDSFRQEDIKLIADELRLSNTKNAVKLYAEHTKQIFTPIGLSQDTPRTLTFEWSDRNKETGETKNRGNVSIEYYFKKRYNITLKYPTWPLIVRGTKAKPTFVPVELCRIAPGQVVRVKQIASDEQSNIIRATAVTPAERRDRILGMMQLAKFAGDSCLREMYVSLSYDMIKTEGRVLEAPQLKYKNSIVTPNNGQWNTSELLHGSRIKKWAFVCCSERVNDRDVLNFAGMLAHEAKNLSMDIAPVYEKVYRTDGRSRVGDVLKRVHHDITGIEMIVVILNNFNASNIYGEVKRVGEQVIGVMTQCLKDDRILQSRSQRDNRNRAAMLLSNILLKMNAKAGGANVEVAPKDPIAMKYLNKPILFIGADVTHPAADDRKSPSIAAVCGNIDNHPNRYVGIELVQQPRKEIITEFKSAVKTLLMEYHINTRLKPETIVFYRDGVADSQFASVLSNELVAIRDACLELDRNYKPGITFVVVQKRHNTRFFKTNLNPRDKASFQNIVPGTVVDRGVTHPVEFNFFLCSHQGIQGTSRPTHYYVLYDDNDFSSDGLQALTYRLCHTYARCTRSVSIPAPCYYAHHIAFRAKTRLLQVMFGSDTASTISGGSEPGLSPDDILELQTKIKLSEGIAKRMYWQ